MKNYKIPEDNNGEQNMRSQNMPFWHIDYFNLKLPEKQLVQEGHSDLSWFP